MLPPWWSVFCFFPKGIWFLLYLQGKESTHKTLKLEGELKCQSNNFIFWIRLIYNSKKKGNKERKKKPPGIQVYANQLLVACDCVRPD